MLIVRLKQCEQALADGRLDRAFELADAADFRADRRGQELVGRLARSLANRGQTHADAGRLVEAAADCDKAVTLAGNTPDVATLRATLSEAAATRLDADRLRGQALAAARRHIDGGHLTVGQNILASLEDDGRADAMKQDLAGRRAMLQSALGKASSAFAAGDWESAVDHLAGLRKQFPSDSELRDLSGKITANVTGQITKAVEAGRLDLAGSLVSRLDRLAHPSIELDHLRQGLTECRNAFDLIRETEAQRAMEILRRLTPLWPKASWLGPMAERLKQLAQTLEEVRSGPLGLAAMGPKLSDPHETLAEPKPAPSPRAEPKADAMKNHAPAGSRFLLHADGIASFQVLTQPVVTIGPASLSDAPDVALMAGSGMPVMTISRADEDYILQSREPVMVNDKPTTGRVLASGDKIAPTTRCRITFRRPTSASGTAVLDLSGARLSSGDVRQVILMDREIVIGPGSGSHVRCDDLAQPAFLQTVGGKLMLRAVDAVQIDGTPASKPAEVVAGKQVKVGPLSFVVVRD